MGEVKEKKAAEMAAFFVNLQKQLFSNLEHVIFSTTFVYCLEILKDRAVRRKSPCQRDTLIIAFIRIPILTH
jgi:hypothetical protein